ncbi:hypothetical protein ABG067_007739, partial [Albugo candida]
MITLSDEREQLECQIVLDEMYFLQEYDTLKRRYYLEFDWIQEPPPATAPKTNKKLTKMASVVASENMNVLISEYGRSDKEDKTNPQEAKEPVKWDGDIHMQVVRSLYRAIPTYGVVRTYYALTGLATKNYFYVLVKMEAGIKK